MNNKTENIDFWIGRVFIVIFLLFLLSFSSSDSNSHIESNSVLIEQVIDIDNSAILIESIGFSNYDNSLIGNLLFDTKISDLKFVLRYSSNKINLQLKCEELQFFNSKPKLLQFQLIHMRIASKTDPLIS